MRFVVVGMSCAHTFYCLHADDDDDNDDDCHHEHAITIATSPGTADKYVEVHKTKAFTPHSLVRRTFVYWLAHKKGGLAVGTKVCNCFCARTDILYTLK